MNGLSLTTTPLMNGAWSDELGLRPSQVGVLVTLQILISALASIVFSSRMHRVAPKRLAVWSGVALLGANVWLAWAASYWALVFVNLIVGLALGCLLVSATAAIAATGRVDRNYAIVAFGVAILVAGLTVLIAHLGNAGGRKALFLSQAAVVVGSLALTSFLPGRSASISSPRAMSVMDALRSPYVFSAVCAQIGSNGIWAFSERIGAKIGMHEGLVGDAIAASALLGVAGALVAAVVARPGRELAWALFGLLTFGAATTLIPLSASVPGFFFTLGAQAFFYVFSTPFITAVGVSRDRSGGLVAASTGWSTLIGAGAPALSGFLVRSGDFRNLVWLSGVSTALSVVAMILVGRSAPRRS
ncbi:MAG: MFS transporter [Caulobacteraceae bacterium]|nr:MFS transporter [Caulobacteraceae bacterium]